jgi:hypothetical protein
MGIYGNGTPLTIDQHNVFRGQGRTNGFLMKNVDGRIPALQEGFSRLAIGSGSTLYADGIVPYGTALWRDTNIIDTNPGGVFADKPTKAWFVGVLKFEQGMQTGHPVAGHGIQAGAMKGTLVRSGLVGYKVSMTAVGQEANYLAYLKGDKTKDTGTVRKIYADWVAAWKAAADGGRLAMFFANASGFPVIALVIAANLGAPTLANCTFGGWVEVLEPENQAVYIALRADQIGVPDIDS